MAKRIPMTPVERMLAGKRRLVKRLRDDVRVIRANADDDIEKIVSRIRIAEALIDALEKGTLKL